MWCPRRHHVNARTDFPRADAFASAPHSADAPPLIDAAIIGTGFAGLGMAIQLKQHGIDNFLVFEKAGSVGGTWRDNHYPGCACDVQSHLYSFSFAPNPDWSRMYSPQPEIRAYLERCTDEFGVRPHVRFHHELARAAFDDAAGVWNLEMADGRRYRARTLISGMGGLSRPAWPNIPGIETFQGKAFHSQLWEHDYDLRGKRVAVIGTGASAIQFVPQIAPKVGRLDLYQRTPPWILPKPDRKVSRAEHWLFRHLPFTQKLMRTGIYWMLESRVLGFVIHPKLMKAVERMARGHIKRRIADPVLREKVTPDYTIGCKRILISNDYYPALTRENVDVITSGIARVEPNAIVTTDGTRREVDCLIFGTGFHATDPFPRGVLLGSQGVDIVDAWDKHGAEAYLGTTVSGFPNFFMVVGPNTGLGHSSMVFMIESQVAYIVDALKSMRAHNVAAIDVRPDVQRRFNDGIQKRLSHAIWSAGGCVSWYLDPKTGKNTTLWPGFTWQFRRATAHFRLADYRTRPMAVPKGVPLRVPARTVPDAQNTPNEEALDRV